MGQVAGCEPCWRNRAGYKVNAPLPTDLPDFKSPPYWLAHPVHHPERLREALPVATYALSPGGSMLEAVDQHQVFRDDEQSALADVFYLHGTMEGGGGNKASINRWGEPWNGPSCPQHQMTMVTAFTGACRAFAPLYRQASGMGGDFNLAYEDVLSAFEQFLSELPAWRPFLLAGHSQGSMHLDRLLSERVATDPVLVSRLVAMYAPGTGRWTNLSFLPLPLEGAAADPCAAVPVALWAAARPEADRKQTLLGWMSRGAEPPPCSNPCTWAGGRGSHLGALLPREVCGNIRPVLYSNIVQKAEVRDGLIRVHPVQGAEDLIQKLGFGVGDYHAYDIHLFWGNIRHHVLEQVRAFIECQGQNVA
ncbi:unnamed protein product [Polarella glacialis]|uniref:DUF3089 domain-containing protein n=1 Tax=Polarella glacialis TaxID=89957 RepID=A0A813FLC7_POLGL|nr:unnamed protein product [Polarella glacialis]